MIYLAIDNIAWISPIAVGVDIWNVLYGKSISMYPNLIVPSILNMTSPKSWPALTMQMQPYFALQSSSNHDFRVVNIIDNYNNQLKSSNQH